MEAIQGKDVEVEWMPFELRPYPTETLKPEGEYLTNVWQSSVYPTATRFGVKMVLPSVSPQPYTHLAFEGFQYAKEHGKASAYNHRMFTAFFQDELDIGSVDVLTELAAEIGLDHNEFRQVLENRKYKEIHEEALREAYEDVQVTSVPTFIVGSYLIPGLLPQDQLERIINEELERVNVLDGI